MKLPMPPGSMPPATRGYLGSLVTAITQALSKKVDANTGAGSVLLVSPDGSVYSVQVTDAGALTTTKLYDGP